MRMKSKLGLMVGAGFMALVSAGALAAGFYTAGAPPAGGTQYPGTIPLTGNEAAGFDTNLPNGQNPASEAITLNQISAFAAGTPSAGNYIIGGDAGTNLWQRGTTGASQTTTVAYGGPDRFAYWSGTNTAMTVSRDNTAGAVPQGYTYDFRMQRTAGQTGTVQMCMAQEISSQWAVNFAGTTAELDFNVYEGANFSGASNQMTAYIVYGTGTDEGVSKLAYGLNGGGGGSQGWTGQANATAAVVTMGGLSTAGRFAAIASIPATATEIAAVLCYTPVGTAGTTDALYFDGIQLKRSSALTSLASATLGYNASSIQASAFSRRAPAEENILQQAYYYQITEGTPVNMIAGCSAVSTTVALCNIEYPVQMRAIPTVTYSVGFATPTTTAGSTLGACTGLATSTVVTGSAPSVLNLPVACTAATVPAAGSATFLYSNGGTGAIKISAEL